MHARNRHVGLADATPEKRVDEDSPELLSKRAVQDKVNSTIEVDEEIPEVREDLVAEVHLHVGVVDGVREVVDQRRDLAHNEDHDDGNQHDGDAVLTALAHIHVLALALRVPHREDQEEVEDKEDEERDDAHDGHVEPGEVHLKVDEVLAEGGAGRHDDGRVRQRAQDGGRCVVEPARDVVQRRADGHARDDSLCARDRAHRRCLQWVTHRDVPLNRERHCQPDCRGLRNQRDRVDVRHDVCEHVSHINVFRR